jgi:uncharacterized Zn finger protein
MGYGGYYGSWAPYVSVAQRRHNAEREVAKLRKKGARIDPVVIEGRTITRTFWGKAWCDNLESYRDYAYRLDRGRSYVRNGSVIDLHIAERAVTAMVSGSDIYQVTVSIDAVAKPQWNSICKDCAGGIDSLVELLQGRLSQPVMERICRQGVGLFPKPAEIHFKCSCPDHASMCKHVAAVLYGVGARLDHQPELLFRLRAVDEKDLVSVLDQALPANKGSAGRKVLEADDLSAMFGLDMAEPDLPPPPAAPVVQLKVKPKPKTKAKPSARKQAAARNQAAADKQAVARKQASASKQRATKSAKRSAMAEV